MLSLIRNVDIAIAYTFDVTILLHKFSAMSLSGGGLVILATLGSGPYKVITSESEKCEYEGIEDASDRMDRLSFDCLNRDKTWQNLVKVPVAYLAA